MSILKRLFSGAYRKALEAEARGDHDGAARAYALAGEEDKVAQMNLLRAEQARTRAEETDALRAALRWAAPGGDAQKKARKRLAAALTEEAKQEAVRASEHGRKLLREAAGLYGELGLHAEAGECQELAGDDAAAAKAYAAAGQIEKMELALARDEQRDRRARRLREAFDEYQLALAGGDRELGRSALKLCVDLAEIGERRGEYVRLLEELEAKRIASGLVRVTVTPPSGAETAFILCGLSPIRIGREPGLELPLRGGGVSRVHAEVRAGGGSSGSAEGASEAPLTAGWRLRDAGSRNGTRIAGARLEGEVPLADSGELELGDDSAIAWRDDGGVLELEVVRGLDRGRRLFAAVGRSIPLPGVTASVRFQDGRPYLETSGAPRLNGARAGTTVQLMRGDLVEVAGARIEVS
jgi:hypothetical protein